MQRCGLSCQKMSTTFDCELTLRPPQWSGQTLTTPYWQQVCLSTTFALQFNGVDDFVNLSGTLLDLPAGGLVIDLVFRAFPPPSSRSHIPVRSLLAVNAHIW